MNYIEIDFNNVKGFKKLSSAAQEVFQRVYKLHNSAQGIAYKEGWVPVSVQETKTHLKVVFRNGDWLHYLPNGTWY